MPFVISGPYPVPQDQQPPQQERPPVENNAKPYKHFEHKRGRGGKHYSKPHNMENQISQNTKPIEEGETEHVEPTEANGATYQQEKRYAGRGSFRGRYNGGRPYRGRGRGRGKIETSE
jgi:hypothetical protein